LPDGEKRDSPAHVRQARSGGTPSRAKLGYLNYIDHSDGRVIRTTIVDSERAPMVKLGFELCVTGEYSLDELADELCDRGLRTRTGHARASREHERDNHGARP
jgi:hypothetical protein